MPYQKYAPTIAHTVKKHSGLEIHNHQPSSFGYSFFCSKPMPTEDRKSKRSRTLEIHISENFMEDNRSIRDLEIQIIKGLSSYKPESNHLLNQSPPIHKINIESAY